MTKKKTPLTHSATSWPEKDIPQEWIDIIFKKFEFCNQSGFKCQLENLYRDYNLLFYLVTPQPIKATFVDGRTVSKSAPKYQSLKPTSAQLRDVFTKIRDESSTFVSRVKPYLQNHELFMNKLSFFRSYVMKFSKIFKIDFSETVIGVKLANFQYPGLYEEGWTSRRMLLRKNLDLLNVALQLKEPMVKHLLIITEIITISEELTLRSNDALNLVVDDKPGRPSNLATNFLIEELYHIYNQGTGKLPTAWRGFYGYGGEFLKFVIEIVEFFEVPAWQLISIKRRIKFISDNIRTTSNENSSSI